MAKKTLDQQIDAILAAAKGNVIKSRIAILRLAQQDPDFLWTLVKPYLPSIAMHQIQRRANKDKIQKTGANKNKKVETAEAFSKELLGAITGTKGAKFGQESASAPIGKRAASAKHVATMNMIARKVTPPKK
ncbi:MAG: hypothetical protein GC136_06795 [Alphaproteobacteria bacterium]|nr:hypothetical protein [Alphaproteobacteria bacterium]